jgi:hypothetical protein
LIKLLIELFSLLVDFFCTFSPQQKSSAAGGKGKQVTAAGGKPGQKR